ncbi:histone H4 transcription factor-like isoform X2 [Nilaparvata lugens]|nr:histone H4 transcription factor-like isoform X2 [Nilaparvata lugens]XP_039288641.1 histone H4 transcription factor-like isoform X2 [Nilaparvata lugens]XP_039288649.1 histone H4 transcription factor-like isoform X2 [Nilaparvata lugens]
MHSESDYDTSFLADEGCSSPPGFASSTDDMNTDNNDEIPKRHFKMMHNITVNDEQSITKDDTDLSQDVSASGISAYTDDDEDEDYDDYDDYDDDDDEYDDDDDHVKVKRRKRVNLSAEELRLSCEWSKCGHPVYSGQVLTQNSNRHQALIDFIDHVEAHALELCSDPCQESYQCSWKDCGFETADENEAKVHVNFHAYHTKLKSIGRNVKDRTQMPECTFGKNNMNVLPEPPETLQCLWENCAYVSHNMLTYLKHVDIHADKICFRLGHSRCLWKDCGMNFANESKLKEHLRVHTHEKVCACPDCGAMFASNTKLLDHCTRQLPLQLQGYQCSHCRRHYPSERILRDHMRSHIKRHKCAYCDMTCATRTTLVTHIRVAHIRHKPFRCRLCPFRCESKQDLLNHCQIHEMRGRYICEQADCDFTCRSNQTLKIHFLKEHEGIAYPYNIYECHECGKQYSRGAYLTTHLKKQHGLQWPSGHKRFAYRPGEDGKYRLQRIRYESLEVNEEIVRKSRPPDMDDCSRKKESESKGVKIRLTMNGVSRSGKSTQIEYEMTIDDDAASDDLQVAHLNRLSQEINS